MEKGLFAVDIVNKPTNLSPYSGLNSQETNLTRSSYKKFKPCTIAGKLTSVRELVNMQNDEQILRK